MTQTAKTGTSTAVQLGHVVVVGANSATGRLLLPQLDGAFGQVTALVREPVDLGRASVIERWTEAPEALAAIRAADAVLLLTGVFAAPRWEDYEEGTVETVRRVAGAIGSRSARVVYVSSMGAASDSGNWYLKAKGLAEELLKPLPGATIFRGQPIVTGGTAPSPFERALQPRAPGDSVTIFGDGKQRVRPINIRDVVAIMLAAARGSGAPGVYNLGGPDEHTLLELVSLANGGEVPVRSLSREAAAAVPGINQTAVDLMIRMQPALGAEDTAARFGVQLTRLSTIWPLQDQSGNR